jgi:hypothetical protein
MRATAYYAVAKFPPPIEHDPNDDGGVTEEYEVARRRSRRERGGVTTGLSYGMKL